MNAKHLALPIAPPRSELEAHYDLTDALQAQSHRRQVPGFLPGGQGHGRRAPVDLGRPVISDGVEITPQDAGTTNHPFTTARADLAAETTRSVYPYSASGKPFFNIGNQSFICSASLIKPGVAVTAAHCVASFGKNELHSNWSFVPGYSNGVAPFGVWVGEVGSPVDVVS